MMWHLQRAVGGPIVVGAALLLAGCLTESALDLGGADSGSDGGSVQRPPDIPSGPHFNLNLIGVPRDKNPDMDGDNGHRIFVDLVGNTKIMLQEGEFDVVDANGTDGTARFQLPAPDDDNDGLTEYSVFARALGTPGGDGSIVTCLVDSTGTEYCSTLSALLIRDRGRPKWDSVSQELLYVYADLDGDGEVERHPLFSDELQDYFWSYDNNGLKLVQLRFYEVPTDVN